MKKHRLLSICLSLVLMSGTVFYTGPAFAADKGDSADQDQVFAEIAKQITDKNRDPFASHTNSKSKPLSMQGEEALPSSFSLINKFGLTNAEGKDYVTPVKFQNPFGTCWGFAAIAAAESSILGNDELNEGLDPKTFNLSEKHLVNFITKPIDDPDDPQNGEGLHYKDENMSLEDKFNMGGLPIYATSLFASGMGPNLENRVIEGYASDIFEYHGSPGETIKRKVNGKWVDFCYSAEDDWSLPEALRFRQSYTLAESYMLPCPAGSTGDDDDPEYAYNAAGTLAIKDELMDKHAVEIAFCADTSAPNQENEGQYISRNWAHYTGSQKWANHAVCIVGWDDNYPRENFIKGNEPPADMFPDGKKEGRTDGGNGAWLVKNSWGSGEEDFPNFGGGDWGIVDSETGKHTGYFWLSYYDQSLEMPEALRFDEIVQEGGYYLDQYDFMPVDSVLTANTTSEVRMSNVFRTDVNTLLEGISCQTAEPGTYIEYEIYLLSDEYSTPVDGVKVASGKSESFEYGGFHKVKLDTPVSIQKGQNYSIIVNQIVPVEGGSKLFNINIHAADSQSYAEAWGSNYWEVGVINEGESFINIGGTWYDYSDAGVVEAVFGDESFDEYSFDNFPIKGYSKKQSNLNLYFPECNSLKLNPVGIGSAESISVRYKGDKFLLPESEDLVWNADEDSLKIFDLAVDEKNPTKAVISAKKPGVGYVTVSADVSSTQKATAVLRVEVSKNGKYLCEPMQLKCGESKQLVICDLNEEPVTEGLTYTSEDPEIAAVDANGKVTGTGVGTTHIIASDDTGAEISVAVEVVKGDQDQDKGKETDQETAKDKNSAAASTKVAQQMTVKGKTVSIKASKLKKNAKKLARKKVIKVSNAKGTLSYKLVSVKKAKYKKYFKINAKTGKLKVKKGLKKGTYKVKVKVTAAGNADYNAMTKTATIKVKVK